ncbi:thioredoxin TrxC [Ideonella alba]|uniref:Thioredoxin TrxC n=1 Tax=Ideonella alba TaxID=2824118 RepID=A0A941BG67_9BURK|nr:thioredoxin TrxC [Ideonella alba]MBQ0930183.1 thioredoxin TrxC [Ideonella alba]
MDSSHAPHIVCTHCGATNRVPAQRLGEDPRCGRCGHALLPGEPVELTDANFAQVVNGTDLPVIVDVWAAWCGPCRMMAPQFAAAAAQMKGRALFAKLDSDAHPRTAGALGIRSIPTLIRLQRGQELARQSGALPAAQIVAFAG